MVSGLPDDVFVELDTSTAAGGNFDVIAVCFGASAPPHFSLVLQSELSDELSCVRSTSATRGLDPLLLLLLPEKEAGSNGFNGTLLRLLSPSVRSPVTFLAGVDFVIAAVAKFFKEFSFPALVFYTVAGLQSTGE